MNPTLLMDKVQGPGQLVDVGDDGVKWYQGAFRVALAQGATRGILHDQKGNVIFHDKIKDAQDQRMHQACYQACLSTEVLTVLAGELDMQYFDGRLGAKMQVFSQIDFSKATSPEQPEQAVVAKPVSRTVSRGTTSSEGSYHVR